MFDLTSRSGRAKTLAIGGDLEVQQYLRLLLKSSDIDLIEAGDGSMGLKRFYDEQPDIVVLDVDLPDVPGSRVLASIRELSDVPVVMISSVDNEDERVKCLREGADDCVTKPLSLELLARIESMLRRPREGSIAAVIRDDFVQIDRARHEVKVLGMDVSLTPTEFRMLSAFAENPGRVLGHGQLLDMVWGDRIRGRDEVKLYVSYVRRKLGRAAGVDPVETVRGVGYRYRPRRSGGLGTPYSSSSLHTNP
jgi:DNA-binding response OmpR family regulator